MRYTRRKKQYKNQKGGNINETACICAIMIKEEPYVDEWIQYYIYGLGFTHIFIYDNSEENSLKDLPNKYPGKVTIRHFPGKVKQLPAYNDFLEKNRTDPNKYTWCAFFDCDEFLVLKEQTNVIDFLKKYCNEGGVGINWYLYGDSHLTEKTNEPVTKRFIMRDKNVNKNIKTIIKCDDVDTIERIHSIDGFKAGKNNKDTNGKIIEWLFNKDGPVDIAVINHYFTKTREEFNTKQTRARADTGEVRPDSNYNKHNFNDVPDNSAYKIYERAQAEYAKIKKGGGKKARKLNNNN